MFNVKSKEESDKSSVFHSPLPGQGALCSQLQSNRLEDKKCALQTDRDHRSNTNGEIS